MDSLILLPVPLPTKDLTLGQLLTNPLSPSPSCLTPSKAPPYKTAWKHQNHEAFIITDDRGRFLSLHSPSTLSEQSQHLQEATLHLTADETSYITLENPTATFDDLRQDRKTQYFLRKAAQDGKPVYYVTGLQTLINSRFKHRAVKDTSPAEATTTSPQSRVSVRRVDSASNIAYSSTHHADTTTGDSEDVVIALEMMKVKCRVGPGDEPHCIEDVEYVWSYHGLGDEHGDEELQLCIGLGKVVEQSEVKALAGTREQEEHVEGMDRSGEADVRNSDEEGIGGF